MHDDNENHLDPLLKLKRNKFTTAPANAINYSQPEIEFVDSLPSQLIASISQIRSFRYIILLLLVFMLTILQVATVIFFPAHLPLVMSCTFILAFIIGLILVLRALRTGAKITRFVLSENAIYLVPSKAGHPIRRLPFRDIQSIKQKSLFTIQLGYKPGHLLEITPVWPHQIEQFISSFEAKRLSDQSMNLNPLDDSGD